MCVTSVTTPTRLQRNRHKAIIAREEIHTEGVWFRYEGIKSDGDEAEVYYAQ
jgi:hypothetical protein